MVRNPFDEFNLPPTLLSRSQVAARLGFSERMIHYLIAQSELWSIRAGLQHLIPPSAVDALIAERLESGNDALDPFWPAEIREQVESMYARSSVPDTGCPQAHHRPYSPAVWFKLRVGKKVTT